MANHDLSNVTTSALKRELERRGWTVHLENGPTAGPSFFERLGDNVHHLLPFLEVRSLCRLDAAMTSREGRETAWLPRLAGLESADLVLKEVGRLPKVVYSQPDTYDRNAAAWLAALCWLVARGVPMPQKIECPYHCFASKFTACFEHCTTAGSVRDIDLQRCSGPFTAAGMMHLQRCTGLTSLNLGSLTEDPAKDPALWEQLDAQNWTCFTTLEGIQSYSPVSIVTAEIWGRRLSALISISIDYCNDGSLEHLCKIKTLQDVSLDCYGVKAAADFEDLVHLNKLPVLRRLCLSDDYFIDAALGHIKDISTLRDLSFWESDGLSAAGIVLIAERFSLLEKLSLHHCDAVTDADVAVLSRLTSLQQLGLSGQENVTDEGVAHLSGLTCLQDLNLSRTAITDAGVAHLSGLTCLQDLNLAYTAITSQSLAVIASLTQLRKLDLSFCGGLFDDDSATMHLKSLTNLGKFNVCHSGFTDAGLDSLHSAVNLENLALGDEYNEEWLITGPALERLVAACTKLKELLFDELERARSIGLLSDAFQAVLKGRGIDVRYK